MKPRTVILSVAVVVLLAAALYSLITNPALNLPLFAKYFTARTVLEGIGVTLSLTLIASAIGLLLGVVLAVMHDSRVWAIRLVSRGAIWLGRSIPVLVHLLIWFNLALFIPTIWFGIPFTEVGTEVSTNTLITSFTAAVLGLSISESAYMAEIVRGGIRSVDAGQIEAADALGMRRTVTMRKIVLPQAMRAIVPPLGNQVILMLKTTSLVSVIAGNDLLTKVREIYNANFQIVPLLLVATVWYLIFCTIAAFLQQRLEKRFGRGFVRSAPSRKKGA